MKNLKIIILSLILSSVPTVYAISYNDLPKWWDNPGDLFIKIINTVLALVTVVAVLFIIIGGVRYLTASGNPDQIQSAKNNILYGIIGLIIVILSYAIVRYIAGAFGINI